MSQYVMPNKCDDDDDVMWGIRLKGGWTLELARVKIVRILSAIAEYWSRMPSVRWPLESASSGVADSISATPNRAR